MSLLKPSPRARLLTLAPILLAPGPLSERELAAVARAMCDFGEERGAWDETSPEALAMFARAIPAEYREKIAGKLAAMLAVLRPAPAIDPAPLLADFQTAGGGLRGEALKGAPGPNLRLLAAGE